MRVQLVMVCALTGLVSCQSGTTNLSDKDDRFRGTTAAADQISATDVDGEKTASISNSEVQSQSPKRDSAKVQENIKRSSAKGNAGSAKKIVIQAYNPPRTGTVFAFKNNWASLEPRLVYKVASTQDKFNNKPAVKLIAINGTGNGASTYLSAADANLLGHKDKKGNTLSSFLKVEKRLQFPMKPGDKWVAQWESMDHTSRKTQSGGGVVNVIGVDTIRTSAGNFKTMKLKLPVPSKAGKGLKHHIWYSPKYGMILKEQIADNRFTWVKEIEKIEVPNS